MKKSELVLANYDGRISKIEIKPQNIQTKVVITSKMYDEESELEIKAKIKFNEVVVVDFRINYFDGCVGSEAFGLYCISDKNFVESVAKCAFERRKEIFILEGDYDYNEDEQNDLLNTFDLMGEFCKHMDEYKAYIQNVDAGVYIIIAKDISIERY